jgi:hypothetical protein
MRQRVRSSLGYELRRAVVFPQTSCLLLNKEKVKKVSFRYQWYSLLDAVALTRSSRSIDKVYLTLLALQWLSRVRIDRQLDRVEDLTLLAVHLW